MNFSKVWNNKNLQFIFYGYVLVAVLTGIQAIMLGPKIFEGVPGVYTNYNNYLIFKFSYFHLIEGKDLYQLYPAEHWDLYKYSPAFSLFFGALAYLPDYIGLIFWNLINVMCFYAAIKLLPQLNNNNKSWILLFCLTELLLSTQNSQSNALMAALIILSFALLERSKYFFATLCIVLSIYIKIFGLVAFVLFLFYPGKIKLIGYTIFWMLVLTLLPAIVVGFHQLSFLYKSWLHLLQNDRSASSGISVIGILQSWFHINISKNILTLAGIIIFCFPLLRISYYKELRFRLLMLASTLVWIVIFNYKAESPTFIIAMAGVAIWYFSQPKNNINLILLLLVFIFTALSSTDICPSFIKQNFIKPYDIKALFPIIVWLKIIYDLMMMRRNPMPAKETESSVYTIQ
jgi:hypothetical protein